MAIIPIGIAGTIGVVIGLVDPSLHGLLLAIVVIMIVAPVALRIARRRFDLFEPLTFFALTMAMIVALRSAAVMVTNDFSWRGVDTQGGLDSMLALTFVGITCWLAGYEFGVWRGASRSPADEPPLRRLLIAYSAVALAVLAVTGTILFLVIAGQPFSWLLDRNPSQDTLFRNSVGYLFDASLLVIPATILALVSLTQGKKWPLMLVSVLIAPLIVSEIVKGGRLYLADWVIAVAVFIFMAARRRPKLIVVAVIAPFVLLGATALREARNIESGVSVATAFDDAISNPARVWWQLVAGADTEAGQGLMFLLTFVPSQEPYHPGVVVTSLVAQPIPRALWPQKPLIPEEQIMAKAFPLDYLRNRAGATFTAMGSLYYDSGVLGVILGMFVAGATLRRSWDRLLASGSVGALAVASTLPGITIAFARASLAPAVLLLFWTTIPILAIKWLASRASRTMIDAQTT